MKSGTTSDQLDICWAKNGMKVDTTDLSSNVAPQVEASGGKEWY